MLLLVVLCLSWAFWAAQVADAVWKTMAVLLGVAVCCLALITHFIRQFQDVTYRISALIRVPQFLTI